MLISISSFHKTESSVNNLSNLLTEFYFGPASKVVVAEFYVSCLLLFKFVKVGSNFVVTITEICPR